MRMGRVLRGVAALSVCMIGSQHAVAGNVDERFPFLAASEANRAPEPKAEAVATRSAAPRPAASRSAVAAHSRASRQSPPAAVPYPRPSPVRAAKTASSNDDIAKPMAVEQQLPVRTHAVNASLSELAAAKAETAQVIMLSETAAPSDSVTVASAVTVKGDVAMPIPATGNEPAGHASAGRDGAAQDEAALRSSVTPGETATAFADPNDAAVASTAKAAAYPTPAIDARAPAVAGASETPSQTVAARMAPLGASFMMASRTVDDPAPEPNPPAAATTHSPQNVGGPFVPMPKPHQAKLTPGDIVVLVENTAVAHGVPLELAHAVVRVESNYNPTLTGRGGTLGLMQIKYATARGIGYSGTAKALMDPAVNLEWGMRYLAGARKLAKGNVCGTILRYQAGHRAVRMTHAAAQYCGRVRHIMAAIR
jgi:soluble lytic murein transglycosylase-like protein